ncbi:MAG: EVE domain-containing protein [Nitrosomonas sp.]|uniref:EVE domain-containing protein n=1 Tax=Nitrosomonas sp. TaxID=42353 RepID=UPI0027374269|nr:EVE domain-containing protein [Nitrosomonas sp.]MDP3280752.1 EVE domain-containing protein [Nitrosomonas sp.]MDP3662666.1 EVE domain-containing protein [Nitrosomonas sp.]MDZ4107151.1 EVE domain-containing protein [Nitrosomonas sp.]
MRYWLMKSEPCEFSIDDFSAHTNQTIAWEGVRNYQSRNFMRNQMATGDQVFFYHSCCKDPGIMGIAVVSKAAYPDATQFNRDNKYFDPKATVNNPRWFNVEITLVKRTRPISIKELRQHNELSRMRVLQTGNRLSITPVDPAEWQFILAIL